MELIQHLRPNCTVCKDGIYITQEIAHKTVWDELAIENPTHAVISAKDEADAAAKSAPQIEHIKAHVTADDTLLDLGCGYGRVAKYLLPEQPLTGYIGVDSSYQMLQLFKRRYESEDAEQATPLLFLNADIHALPLQDASVDTVIVCAVFLHNHKSIVEKSMQEVARVLRPGGKLLVYSSFPAGGTLMGLQGYAYQMLLNLLGKPYKNGPVRYYTRREVLKLCTGFTEVTIAPDGFAVLPKTLIFLPKPLEILYRKGISVPINTVLQKLIPQSFQHIFAVHHDVIAVR